MDAEYLGRLVDKTAGKRGIAGALLHVSTGDGQLDVVRSAGNLDDDSTYYIASINKFFMSALALRLASEGRLDLDAAFASFVPRHVWADLHVLDGTDYSRQITVRQLLSQTSGLPDYLEDPKRDGSTALQDLQAGLDPPWPVAKVVEEVKTMKPHFPPGQPGKAQYIDTGHQLLQLVLTEVTGQSTSELLQGMFDELGMADTHVVADPDDRSYLPVRYQDREIALGRYLSSTGNDIVSTAADQMRFLKAFFTGRFWPTARLGELQRWNRVFYPFQYGLGIQQFALPAALTLFRRVPPMIGHAGSVGSVAFYVPDKNVYFTGTVNQQGKASAIYQPMVRVLMKL